MGELQQILGLRPSPPRVPPSAAPPAWPSAPSVVRIRQPFESPALAPDPDDGDLDDDGADYDDADDYDGDGEGGGFEGTGDVDGAWHGRGTARRPARPLGAPPLGSYESRQAALHGPRRRSRPLRVVLLVVLVFGAIGVSAVKLLARPETRLAIQGAQRSPAAAVATPPPSGPSANTAGTTASTSFAAYPGQQTRDGGQIAVNSVAVGNGAELAVGSADGHPAIWRQGSGSSWTLTDSTVDGPLAGRPGDQALAAVTDGPAGWLPYAPTAMNLCTPTVTANISLGLPLPSIPLMLPRFQVPSPADHHVAAVTEFPVTCPPTMT